MYKSPHNMEPLVPGSRDSRLVGLAAEVLRKSAELGGRLHPLLRKSVASFLRITNSYYSNLIEDHYTHPIDIERALHNEYFDDPVKRVLQIEGKVYIKAQELIESELDKKTFNISSLDFIKSVHKRFYENLPDDLKIIKDSDSENVAKVSAGELRSREVKVGRHIPPSYLYLHLFMQRFEQFYNPDKFYGPDKIVAAAASHHRLTWIHPFLDGNGRIARLFTDAFMYSIPVTGYGLWTTARGFARNREEYLTALTWADAPRQGDLDGRGNLSLKGLEQFCIFFLETCLDQINFMGKLLQMDGFLERIKGYVHLRTRKMLPDKQVLKPEAAYLLQEALLRGQFKRGEAARITGLPERTARMVLTSLVKEGLLVSDTPKGPVYLRITSQTAYYWFPGLFPEKK